MGIINSVVLTGRLCAPASVKSLPSGSTVVEFTLAVNERIRDSSHESGWGTRGNFFDVVGFGAYLRAVSSSLTKGREVTVSGRLRQERWERDGVHHQHIVIVADEVEVQRESKNGGKPEKAEQSKLASEVPQASSEYSEMNF